MPKRTRPKKRPPYDLIASAILTTGTVAWLAAAAYADPPAGPVFVLPDVAVNVAVDPALTFTVDGVPASTLYKGALATSDRCITSATSVRFGTPADPLAPDTDYDCAQNLTVNTNAIDGYQVTIRNSGGTHGLNNTAASAAIADWTGTNTAPTPTPTTNSELFGYTTTDGRLNGNPSRFTASDNLFAGLTASDAEVAHADTSVADDAVTVGFRLRFNALSAAGAYTGKVVYTCTANF